LVLQVKHPDLDLTGSFRLAVDLALDSGSSMLSLYKLRQDVSKFTGLVELRKRAQAIDKLKDKN
jgi:hypothetical protein